jgi:Tfp pilus assembly protein PilW
MSNLLDIFGSVIIAGMLFMLIVKLNLFSSQTSYTSDNELRLIQNTKTLAEIIDYDLRKVGYKHQGTAIVIADSNNLKFYADMQAPDSSGHGSMDVVEYFVSNASEVTGTLNPKDIILKRTIKDSATNSTLESMAGPSLGLVRIKFTYLDAIQQIISYNNANTYPDSIRYIKTEMWVESSDAVTDAFADTSRYSVTYWEFTINPRNI